MKNTILRSSVWIVGFLFFLSANGYSQSCDTLRNYVPDSSYYQFTTSGGTILGQDELSDGIYTFLTDKWAEQYSVSVPTLVTAVRIAPWKVQDNTGGSVVKIQVYSNASNEPGSLLGEKVVPYSDLTAGSWNLILFDVPIPVTGSFWVGYQIPVSKPFNEFALLGTKSVSNHTMAHLTGIYNNYWEETSNIYIDGGGNDLNVAFLLDVLTTANIPVADFSVDNVESCLSGVFTVNGSNSINGINYNWILTDELVNNIYADFNGAANDVVSPSTSNPTNQHLYLWLDGDCFSYDIELIPVSVYPDVSGTVTVLPETCGDGNGSIEITNSSGGNGNYSYSIDGGNTSSSNNLFTNVAPGTYNVEITTGGNSCSYSQTVTVAAQPPAVINANTNESVCENQSITLTASGNGTIEWFENNSLLGSNNSLTVSPQTSTVFDAVLTTTDGCTDTANIVVTVNPTPNVTLVANDTTFCDGNSTMLTATGAQSYTWNNNLGAGDSHSVSPTTTTTYQAIGTDQNGCIDTAEVTLIVLPLDNADFSYQDSVYCQGGSAVSPIITGLSGGTFSAVGQGLLIDNSTGEIDVSASSLGNYTVTYQTAGTCPNSASHTIIIINTPDATFSYSASEFCQNDGTITPTLSGGAMAGVFSAANGLAITGNGQIDLSNSTPGSYTVSNFIVATSTCPETTETFNLEVKETPVVDAGENQIVCVGEEVTLSATTSGGTISWDNGVINNTPFVTTQIGNFTYEATADFDGCLASDQVVVMVDSCLGLFENKYDAISLYPNPASDFVYVKFNQQVDVKSIQLFSIDGKSVQEHFIIENEDLMPLDVSSLVRGTYFVRIITDKTLFSIKISVQ